VAERALGNGLENKESTSWRRDVTDRRSEAAVDGRKLAFDRSIAKDRRSPEAVDGRKGEFNGCSFFEALSSAKRFSRLTDVPVVEEEKLKSCLRAW